MDDTSDKLRDLRLEVDQAKSVRPVQADHGQPGSGGVDLVRLDEEHGVGAPLGMQDLN